jgi:hypothetical protein
VLVADLRSLYVVVISTESANGWLLGLLDNEAMRFAILHAVRVGRASEREAVMIERFVCRKSFPLCSVSCMYGLVSCSNSNSSNDLQHCLQTVSPYPSVKVADKMPYEALYEMGVYCTIDLRHLSNEPSTTTTMTSL